MAKDPVCQMNVDESKTDLKTEHNDQTYYFCARSCKERFEADPQKYLGAKS